MAGNTDDFAKTLGVSPEFVNPPLSDVELGETYGGKHFPKIKKVAKIIIDVGEIQDKLKSKTWQFSINAIPGWDDTTDTLKVLDGIKKFYSLQAQKKNKQ